MTIYFYNSNMDLVRDELSVSEFNRLVAESEQVGENRYDHPVYGDFYHN